jgi:hypothetical protein
LKKKEGGNYRHCLFSLLDTLLGVKAGFYGTPSWRHAFISTK